MLHAATNLLETDPSLNSPSLHSPSHNSETDSKDLSSIMSSLPTPSPASLYNMLVTTFASSSTKPSATEETTSSTPPSPRGPPPAILVPKVHPLEPEVTAEVDGYFIEHWPFPNEKAVQKFRDAGFSYVTCCYYPEALPDRIHFGCRLLTVLFLIDGNTTYTQLDICH